jgi:AAA domain
MGGDEDTALSGPSFVREYFAGTRGNIFLGCFRNADSELPRGQVAKLVTRATAEISRFIVSYDKPEPQTAIYYCTATLRNGHASRATEDCWEFVSLFADIDDKNHDLSWGRVITLLEALPCPPTLIINSGHGLQPHWLLTTPSEDAKRIEALRKKLQSILASDAVPDAPRLMRLPGSHNSKFGDWLPVEVVRNGGKRHPLDGLESWLKTADVVIQPLHTKKGQPQANSTDEPSNDAGPVNVEERLAAMRFKGSGSSAIHITQLQCTASRLRSSIAVENVVTEIYAATQRCVAGQPAAADWDWRDEKRKIERMCFDFINKNPELVSLLPDNLFAAWQERLSAGETDLKITHSPQLHWQIGGGQPTDAGGENKNSGPRFRLLRYCDLRPGADPDYRVDELLPIEGLVVVWGKFKCLKTFWVYDLMLHVAKGWEYRDRAVRQGLVIYCAFEGAHGFGKRSEAQRRHYGLPDNDGTPLLVMPCQMNLVTDHKKFVSDIHSQLETEQKPAVVVLDTLNRSLVGSESKDADMSAYIAAANAIREAFSCLVIIVHHCGWDESRPRGHSSLPAAIEGQLAVIRDGDHITVAVEFLRDGPEGAEIHSVTKVIEVGHDGNGKALTSLVVLPSDSTAPVGGALWPKALAVFRRAMVKMLALCGEDFQEEILEPPVRAVSVEEVRTEFYATYPAKGDNPEQRQAAKQKQFRRCLERAQAEGYIRVREPPKGPPMIWFASRSTTREDG